MTTMKPLTLFLLALTTQAQTLLPAMEWRNIGPFRGGRAVAVTGIPGDTLTYYFGSAGGGVYKTTDAGENWRNITDGFVKTSSVGAVAVAPSDPNVVYIGMGEHPVRGVATSHGDGIYKSTDAGRTWKHIGLSKTRAIARIRIHPTNENLVYIAAQGAPFGPTKDRGVYRTKDGGKAWELVLGGLNENSGCSELAMDPSNPRILYAAFWDHIRHPWEVHSGGPGSGIWKSSDGGDTWEAIMTGLPKTLGKIGVDVSATADRLYAIVEADPDGGVYRSDNAGKSWTLVNSTWALKTRSWYYMEIFADPKNADVVWVLNAGIHKSIDGGKTFTEYRAPHGDHHDLWINPTNPNILINANDGGANISFNGGVTWSTTENQPTAQFYRVNADDRFPYWVYGGQQDNTSVGIASRVAGPGIGWKDWYPVGGCESAYVAFDRKNPKHVYAGCYQGLITEFDQDERESRDVQPYPAVPLALPSREMKYRFNWNAPIAVSTHDPKIIYFASQKLLRSEDRGHSWKEVSPDLTHPDDKTQGPGGGPITNEGAGGEVYNTIFYVAESPHDKNTLWTGTDDGAVQLTRDGGKSWTKVTPPNIGEAQINAIEVSPHDPGTAYVALTRYKFNDFTPHIFKTIDYGKTWERLVDGIGEESWVRVVREDPKRKDLLYAGTESGIYVSFNGGRKWQPFQLNLPVTAVTDLLVHGNDLIAATQGRAFWILDDLAPLRQVNAGTEFTLFRPSPAIRTRLNNTGRGPAGGLPPRLGKNPPGGAIIDFYLPAAPENAKVELLDGRDQLVRTLTALTLKQGMNRVVWNLRRDAIPPIPGVFLFSSLDGRQVPPGAYKVRVTSGGVARTQTLEVVKDPRTSMTAADFKEQEDLGTQIDRDLKDVHLNALKLRKVRDQIEALVKNSPEVADASKSLIEKLNAIEETLIQKRTIDMQTVINFPVQLDHNLATVRNVIDDDAPVTGGAKQRYADLQKVWARAKEELDAVLKIDLNAFNKAVRDKDIAPVVLPK